MRAARKALSGRAAVGADLEPRMIWSSTYTNDNTERVGQSFVSYSSQAYAGNAIVFAVIGKRMAVFSDVRFTWQDVRTGRLFTSPALNLLQRPWANADSGELLARMEQDASLAGNAFIRTVHGILRKFLRSSRSMDREHGYQQGTHYALYHNDQQG
jgi:hypothetical protein